MSASLQRGRLSAEERLERLVELQALLAKVSREIGPALQLQPVLQTVLSAMRSMVEFRGGTIQLVDEGGVYIVAADPPVTAELAATRVPVGEGLSGVAVATASTVYSPDLDEDPRVDRVQRQVGNNATTHSYLVVPLLVLGDCIGAMQVDSDSIDAFTAEDRAVLEGLATQVAGAIESARRFEHITELKRLKDDFIALISHELRTPLTIIGGFTDTLLQHDDRLGKEERMLAVSRIKVSVDRLRSLLEEVLDVSSLDAGVKVLHAERVMLAPLAATVRDLSVDPSRVEVDVRDELCVTADGVTLRHILNQLVDNALKYGGDAIITAVSPAPPAGEVIVSVRDHGPGIAAERRDLVFERFWRGQHHGPGMGLGLAMVRQLAGFIGARIELVDPPGGGAQFDVVLPFA